MRPTLNSSLKSRESSQSLLLSRVQLAFTFHLLRYYSHITSSSTSTDQAYPAELSRVMTYGKTSKHSGSMSHVLRERNWSEARIGLFSSLPSTLLPLAAMDPGLLPSTNGIIITRLTNMIHPRFF